jgi:FlaA1/EpsC-like NDP-sugar epimerase
MSFFGIDALLAMVSIVGVRGLYRLLDAMPQRRTVRGQTALIYGAGHEGQLILRALLQDPQFAMYPVGFLDDNPQLHDRIVQHIPVMGSIDDLQSIVARQPISSLIISCRIEPHRLRQIIRFCEKQELSVVHGRVQLEMMNQDSLSDIFRLIDPDIKLDKHG